MLTEQAAAPERRIAQRALADELTTLVHGKAAATNAAAAADVLFPITGTVDATNAPDTMSASGTVGLPPIQLSPEVLAVVAGEAPSVAIPGDLEGLRVHELLIEAGVAKSNSDVNRLLAQGAIRAGNRVLEVDGLLRDSDLLAGGYLLLRKGKRDFVIGKVPQKG